MTGMVRDMTIRSDRMKAAASSGYSTVCAQGDVRGVDGVPRTATPVVPYPCEYDWYCGNDWDLGIVWDPGRNNGIGGPGRPGRGR